MIRFGPAGLGGAKGAEAVLEKYAALGLQTCEIAFTYSVYLKEEDARRIGAKARELGMTLSIHAPYFVNLSSDDAEKREKSKASILGCCEAASWLGADAVVFHPGYYLKKGKELDREGTYDLVRQGIEEMMAVLGKKKWEVKLAPETMGKVNVFGSVEEISRLSRETGCSFCIDYAHILAREKKVDYAAIEQAFPGRLWFVHFSGIEYGELGEKKHLVTERSAWEELLAKLPKDREIRIVNESPAMVEDSVEGLEIWRVMGKGKL